jgi:hypothetical protein
LCGIHRKPLASQKAGASFVKKVRPSAPPIPAPPPAQRTPIDLLYEWLAFRQFVPDTAEWTDRKLHAHPQHVDQFLRICALCRAFGLPDDIRGLEDGSFLYEISDDRYGLTVIAIATVILSNPRFRHLAGNFQVTPEFSMDNVVDLAETISRDDLRSFYRELLEFLVAHETLRGWTADRVQSPLGHFAALIEDEATVLLKRAEAVEYFLGIILSPEPRAVDLDVLIREFGYTPL